VTTPTVDKTMNQSRHWSLLEDARPARVLLVPLACIVAGAVFGGLTNAINGAIGPEHFRVNLRWQDVQQIWRATVAQGVFAGLIYGVLFSVVFTAVVGLVSRARCAFAFVWSHLMAVFFAILCCWAASGVIGIGLAALSPEFFRHTFPGVPEGFGPLTRYAWVGGSTFGALFGALLAAVLAPILFAIRWRRLHGGSLLVPEKPRPKSASQDV